MKTIEQAELELTAKLQSLLSNTGLPLEGYRASVRLHGKQRDKKRSATVESFRAKTDSIVISFEAATTAGNPDNSDSGLQTAPRISASAHKAKQDSETEIDDLIGSLARVEARPGYTFVALKWFRDVALPGEGSAWTQSEAKRRQVLSEAIEAKIILTSKVPNPRNPQFPVTGIRLNRLLPRVKRALGLSGDDDLDFRPIEIKGEPLSATILRERR